MENYSYFYRYLYYFYDLYFNEIFVEVNDTIGKIIVTISSRQSFVLDIYAQILRSMKRLSIYVAKFAVAVSIEQCVTGNSNLRLLSGFVRTEIVSLSRTSRTPDI